MTTDSGTRWRTLSLVAVAIWLAIVAWQAWAAWPTLPLDVSAADRETRTALEAARQRHLIVAALYGLAPPLAAYAAAALFRRRR
jgi:hypothetical protein